MGVASAGSARSPPGHGTPRPSPLQNTPKADSRIPPLSFSVFSGTRTSGRCTAKPGPRAHCKHDEHDFEAFEKHRFQTGESGDPVHERRLRPSRVAKLGRRALEDSLLIA